MPNRRFKIFHIVLPGFALELERLAMQPKSNKTRTALRTKTSRTTAPLNDAHRLEWKD